MIKFKKYLLGLLLLVFIASSFACDQTQDIEVGYFKKPIDIVSINNADNSALLILDNKANQLFLYNLKDKCFVDFSKKIPLRNGLILPKYPYKVVTSSDNKKAVVVSSNGVLSIINLKPYFDFYQKDCKQTTIPFIEYSKQLKELPSDIIIRKSTGFSYELLLVNKTARKVEFYNYDGNDFTLSHNKTYNEKINYLYYSNNNYYISLKNQKSIIKIASDGAETIIDLTDISINYANIDKFIVTDEKIYIYSQYENIFLIWDRVENKYIEIPASYNPLDSESDEHSKSLKLSYNLNSMSLYKQEYNIADDKLLNDLGYLKENQLLEGNYILLTDVGGYFYFLTLDTDKKLITEFFEDDFDSLNDYKDTLDKRFLKYHIPLQTDYKAEIISVIQSDYCTQFNKHEANQCFSVVNEDENSTDNRYIILKDKVKDREYDLANNYFKFTFEAGLENFISDDGSFISNNKLFSSSIDFSKLTIESQNLQLEIISELPESKIDDVKCEKYKTNEEELKEGETNRKYFRLVPIGVIDGHELTLDVSNDPNLSYCYDEAIAFQVRVKNLFLVTTTQNGEIGTTSYCTNNKEINPFCNGEDTELCPIECENAPFYENDLFKVKIFSDKGDMSIDSYISFSLGVTSIMSRYRSSIISPLKATIFKNTDTNQSKNGIAIVDSYGNDIFVVDTNSFSEMLTIIQ